MVWTSSRRSGPDQHLRPSLVGRFERIAWADAQWDELRYDDGQPVANARLRHHPGYRLLERTRAETVPSTIPQVTSDDEPPWYGTDGRAVEAFASSLESPIAPTHPPF